MSNTMRELAIASVDGEMVNALTNGNPILGTLIIEEANRGIQNVAKKVSDVTGAQVVDMDEALPTVTANGELVYTDVSYLSGLQEVGVDHFVSGFFEFGCDITNAPVVTILFRLR